MENDLQFVDTHAHLYAPEFAEDKDQMMSRAIQQGVKKIYLPNIDSASIETMLQLESAYPEICSAMIGLHPCSVKADYMDTLGIIEEWLQRRPFSGIGETGTDLYWDKTFIENQIKSLEQHIAWAKEYMLPVVLHSRESLDLNISIVQNAQDGNLTGVFHCFTGTYEQANQIIDLGFFLGIGGVVTFKNSAVAEVVSKLPLDSLVLETDSPYLSPDPYRGKRNESAYIPLIAKKIAIIKGMPVEEIAQATTANAQRLFSQAARAERRTSSQ